MASHDSSSKAWQDFEHKVADIFALQGFEPTHDTRFAGRQTDVLLKHSQEYIGSVLVECKHSDSLPPGNVGAADVEAFLARVIRLRNSGDINAGYLITNAGFTADAKGSIVGRPEEKFVFLRTFESLLRGPIDFVPYLRRFIGRYEADEMSGKYEPLYIFERKPPQWDGLVGEERNRFDPSLEDDDFVPILPRRLTRGIDKSQAVTDQHKFPAERMLWSKGVDGFLSTPDATLKLVVGDFGSGKTTSCLHVCYRMAIAPLQPGYTGRIPIYIPLRHFSYTGTAQSLIVKYLTDDVGLHGSSYDAFDAMNRAGLLFVVLDGFDEMSRRVTRQVRDDSFRALGDLCQENSKVILLGRPGYFPGRQELVRAMDILQRRTVLDDVRRSVNTTSDTYSDDLLLWEIAPLNRTQIKSFLAKRATAGTPDTRNTAVEALVHAIERTYNLTELSRRPILLEMISETNDDILAGNVTSIADLYLRYTRTWLDIDINKGEFRRLCTYEDRLFFSMVLAGYLFSIGRDGVRFTELQLLVADHFQLNEAEDIDHFSSDVATCTFLSRDDSGVYSFAHLSFAEYFYARLLAAIIMNDPIIERVPEQVLRYDDSLAVMQQEMPKVLMFLDSILAVPLTPAWWLRIWELMQGESAVLKLGAEEEDTWNLVAEDMAAGQFHADELSSIFGRAKWAYGVLSLTASRLRDSGEHGDLSTALDKAIAGDVEVTESRVLRRKRKGRAER